MYWLEGKSVVSYWKHKDIEMLSLSTTKQKPPVINFYIF